MKTISTLILTIFTAVACSSCSSDNRSTAQTGQLVTSAEDGDAWAFTVDSGHVYSESGAAIFESGGTKYALNGTAKGMGYTPIDSIWRTHPESTSGQRKIDISPYIQAALANPN